MSSIISEEELHPLLLTLPAMFAKLSIIWCPLLNLYVNKNIRFAVNEQKMMRRSNILVTRIDLSKGTGNFRRSQKAETLLMSCSNL